MASPVKRPQLSLGDEVVQVGTGFSNANYVGVIQIVGHEGEHPMVPGMASYIGECSSKLTFLGEKYQPASPLVAPAFEDALT